MRESFCCSLVLQPVSLFGLGWNDQRRMVEQRQGSPLSVPRLRHVVGVGMNGKDQQASHSSSPSHLSTLGAREVPSQHLVSDWTLEIALLALSASWARAMPVVAHGAAEQGEARILYLVRCSVLCPNHHHFLYGPTSIRPLRWPSGNASASIRPPRWPSG